MPTETPIFSSPSPSPHIHPLDFTSLLQIKRLRRPPILGPHVIRKRLGLLVSVVLVAVVVRVRVVGRANVFHAVDAAAFGAAFDGAFAGHLVFFGV